MPSSPALCQQAEACLETARLRLPHLTAADAPALVRLFAQDWDAVKQTGRMPFPPTEPAMRRWIAEHGQFAGEIRLIRQRSDDEPVGAIGFGGTEQVAELGYALGRRFWGRGYATEAACAMVERARTLGLRRLDAYSFVENPASAQVLIKAGFAEFGTIDRRYPERGGRRRVRSFRAML